MDCKQIEQLLEKYWQCETSLGEEQQLRHFFVSEEVPPHLLTYKELFVYQYAEKEVGLGDEFDQRMIDLIESPVVEAKHITLRSRLMPLLKAAAVVVFVAMIGNVVQYSVQSGRASDYDYDSYVDTYDTPEAAYQQVSSALLMLSEGINKSKDKELMDILQLNSI